LRTVVKLLKWMLALVVLAVLAGLAWLYVSPPALLRGGANYAAKTVCSNVFIAGRDPSDVLALDIHAPAAHPVLDLITARVDQESGIVRAGLLGIFGKGLAVARAGTGCASVPDGDIARARQYQTTPPPLQSRGASPADELWPAGAGVEPSADPRIAEILDDPEMTGPGMRAVVVVQGGRIIAERYGEGFNVERPLLGWSMTKTVTAAIIGTLVADGRLSLDKARLFAEWAGDERASISIADLLAMSSGLEFQEDYGSVTDTTRMLFLEPDMAAFAREKPLVGPVSQTFSYSSGTSVLLSRIWEEAIGERVTALSWPREALFGPLGMDSAVLEADARGTFVGSSYMYASAQDWARFGQLLLNGGVWNDRRILPEGFVNWMREPAPASNGQYGRGHLWLRGPRDGAPRGENADAGFDLPDDIFWVSGYEGQSMAIVPSLDLLVVRMGLTPARLAYRPQKMVEALARAFE
jgi:CubicO group peptidase (beta-lactamase class C family)